MNPRPFSHARKTLIFSIYVLIFILALLLTFPGLDQIEASTKRLLRRTTARAPHHQQLQQQFHEGNGIHDSGPHDSAGQSPTHTSTFLAAAPPDSRTAFLLASRGIDADKALHTLGDINLALSFEPLQAIPDTDIDAYLRHEHETLVSLAVQETISRTLNDFEGAHYFNVCQLY